MPESSRPRPPSPGSPPALAAEPALKSGIDKSNFDPAVRPAGRPVPPRQRQVAQGGQDPGRPAGRRGLLQAPRPVRGRAPRHHRGRPPRPTGRRRGPEDRRPVRRFMDEARADKLGLDADPGRTWTPSPRSPTRPGSSATLAAAPEGRACPGLFRAFVRHRRQEVRPVHRLPRPGRPRPARRVVLPRPQVRGRSARRTSPTSARCSSWPRLPDPEKAAARVMALETAIAGQGPLGPRQAAATPR